MSDQMPPEVETVTITKGTFERMLESHRFLRHLEEWGVDNWDGYGHAKAAMRKEDEEDDADEET
jgi:hypothetical protein